MFSAWCYQDVTSLSIPIILNLEKTRTAGFNYSYNCRFRMAASKFDLFYDVIPLNNEWNRCRLAIILQCWHSIDSWMKYPKSQLVVTRCWFFIDSHEFKIVETALTGSNWLDNCLSRMEKFDFYTFHNVIHLNNEWNRSCTAKIIQHWYDIDSQIKYLKSRVDVTLMLAVHQFPWVQK